MFLIAYVMVESEPKDLWSWFLSILIEDIGSIDERAWTFMSDYQIVKYPKKKKNLLFKCVLMCFFFFFVGLY